MLLPDYQRREDDSSGFAVGKTNGGPVVAVGTSIAAQSAAMRLLNDVRSVPATRAAKGGDLFLWTDIETEGLDPKRDRLLALGIIVTDDKFQEIARREWIRAAFAVPLRLAPEVRAMHTASGLLDRMRGPEGKDLVAIDCEAAAFVDSFVGPPAEKITERPAMAGNSVHFDRSFLEGDCPELFRRYSYRSLDVSAVRLLAHATVPGSKEAYALVRPEPAKHTPLADLEASIAELAYWRAALRGGP